jgi:hypothetical protein
LSIAMPVGTGFFVVGQVIISIPILAPFRHGSGLPRVCTNKVWRAKLLNVASSAI